MATYTLTVNETTKQGRNLLSFLRTLDSIILKKAKEETEWTAEEEKAAFLFTSKLHSAEILAKAEDEIHQR